MGKIAKKVALPVVVRGKVGKPRKYLDEKLIFDLAKIHCTAEEISTILDCSRTTIYEHYADVLRKGHEEGKMSLKRKMHEKAMTGDTPMLIWLSKQRLGYRDRHPDEQPVTNFNVFVNEIPK
jgi:hypothetical protein